MGELPQIFLFSSQKHIGRVRGLQWRYQRARLSFNTDRYNTAAVAGATHPVETAEDLHFQILSIF
jgi:hypothetical protein